MHEFMYEKIIIVYEDIVENINNYYPRAHFIIFLTAQQSLHYRNEEKLVARLVHSSFARLVTSGFRVIPYSLVVVAVCAQIMSEPRINPYSPQHGIVTVVLVTSPDKKRRITYGTNIHSESQYTWNQLLFFKHQFNRNF